MKLHRLSLFALAALAAAVTASFTPAAASASKYPIASRARTPGNAAGVVIHRYRSTSLTCFDLWDNVHGDDIHVWASWNYVGVRDRVKYAISETTKPVTTQCRPMPRGHSIYFRIWGYEPGGAFPRKSRIFRYRLR